MENNPVTLTINNIPVTVSENTTILQAAAGLNIKVPSLCYHPDLNVEGSCRVCVVEVKGVKELVASCATKVEEGMQVFTHSHKVRTSRKTTVELLLSEHNADCTKCFRNGNCELQWLASEYRIGDHVFHDLVKPEETNPDSSRQSMLKDDSRCIRCQRCVRTCSALMDVGTFSVVNTGQKQKISTYFEKPLKDVFCIECGQCILRCPTAALTENPEYETVWEKLENNEKHKIVTVTPAARAAIAEENNLTYNADTDLKINSALKLMGFNSVLDYGFFGDVHLLELCTDFLAYLKKSEVENSVAPYIWSCSEAGKQYLNNRFPEVQSWISKSSNPQLMAYSLISEYYSAGQNLLKKDVSYVAVSPCTAVKSFGRNKIAGNSDDMIDIHLLTTRELSRMFRQAGIDIGKMTGLPYNEIIGRHSGASILTEVSGGIAEGLIRTLFELVTGDELPDEWNRIMTVRGEKGIKEFILQCKDVKGDWKFLENREIKFAVINGNHAAADFFSQSANQLMKYDFIEVMVCKGGCVGGGSQPIPFNAKMIKQLSSVLFELDDNSVIKKSHQNMALHDLYRQLLKHPGSDMSKKMFFSKE